MNKYSRSSVHRCLMALIILLFKVYILKNEVLILKH